MKKIITLTLALTVLVMAFTGCGKGGKDVVKLKDDHKIGDIVSEIDVKFKEKYGEDYRIGFPVDESFVTDACLLTTADVAEFSGEYANNMVRNDAVIVLKAADGKVETVKKAMETYKQSIIDRYQTYPVGGSLERAQASTVTVKGDYVIYLCMGDFNMETDTPQFEEDMKICADVVNSMFTA